MEKKLPIYTMILNETEEESGVNYVALVDEPAIERNWFAFNKQMNFKADKDRRIITGPLMIADLPIYRRNESMGEFYVVFSKSQIELMCQKLMRKGFQHNVNEMHLPSKKVEGVNMFEIFLSDNQRGIHPPDGFEDTPEGSLFASYKVDNEEIWSKVKDGTFMGFSVEGMFELVPQKKTLEQEIIDIIKEIQE